MPYEFVLTDIIPTTPIKIYDAWLDSRGHSRMTGGDAEMTARVGGRYKAWDGYIEGKTLKLVPGKMIVQSWRTTNFTEADSDSTITVTLEAVKGGTRITLKHSNVPDTHTTYEKGGWKDHYFDPMKKYFGKPAKKAKTAKKKPAAKRKKRVTRKAAKRKRKTARNS